MPRHVTSCHVMSRHVASCHVMSRHVTSCHVMSRHVTSCHVMSRHVTSCHVITRHVTSIWFLSRDAHDLKFAICAYVRPIFEYASPIWSPYTQIDIYWKMFITSKNPHINVIIYLIPTTCPDSISRLFWSPHVPAQSSASGIPNSPSHFVSMRI